jgi:ATP-dependent protease ClpP protease subunit
MRSALIIGPTEMEVSVAKSPGYGTRLSQAVAEMLMARGVDLVNRRLVLGTSRLENNLGGEVNFALQIEALTAFEVLETNYAPEPGRPAKEHIDVLLTSFGGDLYHSLAIFDRIQQSTVPVHIHVFGPCMSGGSLILQAGTKRILYPSSRLMIHYGFTGDEGTSNPTRMEEVVREHRELMDRLVEIYWGTCNREELASDMRDHLRDYLTKVGCARASVVRMLQRAPVDSLAEAMLRHKLLPVESYLNADAAVRYGLADEVVLPGSRLGEGG